MAARTWRGRWPLLPVAPAIVAAVALAIALAIALLGLSQLRRTSDDTLAVRASALSGAMAARLRATPIGDRGAVLARAEAASGVRLVLVDQSGKAYLGVDDLDRAEVVDLLIRGRGFVEGREGRRSFSASALAPPLEHLAVIALVVAPDTPPSALGMTNAVAVLTLLLTGAAVAVVMAFMRAARDEVAFVARRIAVMAAGPRPDVTSFDAGLPGDSLLPPRPTDAEPAIVGDGAVAASRARAGASAAGEAIPIRSLDEVGLLTATFNVMVGRFAAAERSYRADLRRAAEIDTERSQFLAGLSHELRTPLNAILGFTHVLESEAEGPLSADAKEALAQVRLSGEHLRTLIDDIIDLSAMETGQVRLARAPLDVLPLVEQVVRESAVGVKRQRVALTVSGDPDTRAWADARRLRQVLTNLVSNAVKFTAAGGVHVHVARAPGYAVVSVADSGSGIAESELATIFEPYQQAGDPTQRRSGAGLGLAIARRLVLLHGGRISVASEPGRGSTFTVRVPDETAARGDSLLPAPPLDARPTPEPTEAPPTAEGTP